MTTATPQAPAEAEHLVRLAELTRAEYRARRIYGRVSDIVGDIPEGEATDEDLDYVTDAYMAWTRAWEALQAHRTGQEN